MVRFFAFALACTLPFFATAQEWSTQQIAGMSVHVYDPGTPGPRGLLLALHGCAQGHTAIQRRAGLERAAARGVVMAVPAAPNGGVLLGCWDYYGANHARTGRHDGALIGLAEALRDAPSLRIDPQRMGIIGLSSGAGQSVVMGCLAPDLFSAVGVLAGPAIGTSAGQIAGVATTAERAAATCTQLAGPHAGAFDRQVLLSVTGSGDYTVAQGYAAVNAEMAAQIYGVEPAGESDAAELPGHMPAGRVRWWADGVGPRVALVELQGVGHAWPAGTGPGPEIEFVASQGPDATQVLVDLMLDRVAPPAPTPDAAPPPPPPEDAGVELPEPDAAPEPESCVLERVEATLPEHTLRLGTYDGVYGAADVAYTELLIRYGVGTPFALHRGADERWYLDPDNVPCAPVEPPPPPPEPVDDDAGATPVGPPPGVGVPLDAGPGPALDGGPGVTQPGGGCQQTPAPVGLLAALAGVFACIRRRPSRN